LGFHPGIPLRIPNPFHFWGDPIGIPKPPNRPKSSITLLETITFPLLLVDFESMIFPLSRFGGICDRSPGSFPASAAQSRFRRTYPKARNLGESIHHGCIGISEIWKKDVLFRYEFDDQSCAIKMFFGKKIYNRELMAA